jgi:hypothetical protein
MVSCRVNSSVFAHKTKQAMSLRAYPLDFLDLWFALCSIALQWKAPVAESCIVYEETRMNMTTQPRWGV